MTGKQSHDQRSEQARQIEDPQLNESTQDEIRGGLGQLNANRTDSGNTTGS